MTRLKVRALVGVASTLGLFGSLPVVHTVAQEGTPATCAETTPEENEQIVQSWFEALNGGSPQDVAAVAAENLVYHDPSPAEEAQTGGTAEWAGDRQLDFPDLTVTVEKMVAEGDTVASMQRYTGTQAANNEEGVEVTGGQAEWVSMTMFRIECGKIAEIWSVADELGQLEQLGIITADELQSAEPAATPAP